jgi:hypothetical protein
VKLGLLHLKATLSLIQRGVVLWSAIVQEKQLATTIGYVEQVRYW